MTYRRETETLKQRVQTLERELAHANETIERLHGHKASATDGVESPSRLWNVPALTRRVRELRFEIDDAGYEAIAELLRNRYGTTSISQVGRSLSATIPSLLRLRITRTDNGGTRVVLTNPGPPSFLLGAFALLGALFTVAPVGAILRRLAFTPLSLLVAFPLGLTAWWYAVRVLARSSWRAQEAKSASALETIVDLAERHAKPSARIADAAPDVTAAETEHRAEQQAARGIDESAHHG